MAGNLDELVVVSLPMRQGVAARFSGKDHWFHAETCSRHLMVGLVSWVSDEQRKEWQDSKLNHAAKRHDPELSWMFQGKDAYEFLLRFVSGMESKYAGEQFALSEFKARWIDFQAKHAESGHAKPLMQHMEHAIADSRIIRTKIYKGEMAPNRYESSAAHVAGTRAGQTVLVIADQSGNTKDAVRALGKSNSRSVAKLLITHPSAQALEHRMSEIQRLKLGKFVDCATQAVPFEQAMGLVDSVDHVFVCRPTLKPEDAVHERIVNEWKTRKRDGKLVLLYEKPMNPAANTGYAALGNTVLPGEIKTHLSDACKASTQTMAKAAHACEVIAEARGRDLHTWNMKDLLKHSDEPAHDQAMRMDTHAAHRKWVKSVEGIRGAKYSTRFEPPHQVNIDDGVSRPSARLR